MNRKHLQSIDFWKGITILSVLNIHTVFWSGALYLPDWTKRVSLLLDVPVFFFISGYLLQTPQVNLILGRGLRQFLRLVVDYAIVFTIALGSAIVINLALSQLTFPESLWHTLSLVSFHPIGPLWEIWRGFDGSMWFLFVYFSILPLGVLILVSPLRHVLAFAILIPIVFFFWTAQPNDDPALLFSDARSVAFYLTVFIAGAVFKSTVLRFSIWRLLVIWAGVLVLSLAVSLQAGTLPDLQSLKFPTSPLYLLFSMHSILILCLLIFADESNRLQIIPRWILAGVSWCGKYSFRIYLWQGLATSVPYLFIPSLIKHGVPGIALYGITLVWTVGATLAITLCHNHIESLVTRKRNSQIAKGIA